MPPPVPGSAACSRRRSPPRLRSSPGLRAYRCSCVRLLVGHQATRLRGLISVECLGTSSVAGQGSRLGVVVGAKGLDVCARGAYALPVVDCRHQSSHNTPPSTVTILRTRRTTDSTDPATVLQSPSRRVRARWFFACVRLLVGHQATQLCGLI